MQYITLAFTKLKPTLEKLSVLFSRTLDAIERWYVMSPDDKVNYKHDTAVVMVSIVGAWAVFMIFGWQLSLLRNS